MGHRAAEAAGKMKMESIEWLTRVNRVCFVIGAITRIDLHLSH